MKLKAFVAEGFFGVAANVPQPKMPSKKATVDEVVHCLVFDDVGSVVVVGNVVDVGVVVGYYVVDDAVAFDIGKQIVALALDFVQKLVETVGFVGQILVHYFHLTAVDYNRMDRRILVHLYFESKPVALYWEAVADGHEVDDEMIESDVVASFANVAYALGIVAYSIKTVEISKQLQLGLLQVLVPLGFGLELNFAFVAKFQQRLYSYHLILDHRYSQAALEVSDYKPYYMVFKPESKRFCLVGL